jgi:hypothetical protein
LQVGAFPQSGLRPFNFGIDHRLAAATLETIENAFIELGPGSNRVDRMRLTSVVRVVLWGPFDTQLSQPRDGQLDFSFWGDQSYPVRV